MKTRVHLTFAEIPTEKLMRGGFGGGATPPTGGLGGRTPQRLGLSGKIGSNDRF